MSIKYTVVGFEAPTFDCSVCEGKKSFGALLPRLRSAFGFDLRIGWLMSSTPRLGSPVSHQFFSNKFLL